MHSTSIDQIKENILAHQTYKWNALPSKRYWITSIAKVDYKCFMQLWNNNRVVYYFNDQEKKNMTSTYATKIVTKSFTIFKLNKYNIERSVATKHIIFDPIKDDWSVPCKAMWADSSKTLYCIAARDRYTYVNKNIMLLQ